MEKDKNTDTSSSKLTGSLWFTSSTCTIIFSRYTVISVRNVRLFRPSHRFTCKMRCTWGTYPKTTQWPKCYDRCPKTSRSAPERYSVNVINRRRATNQPYSGFHCQARDKKVIRVRSYETLKQQLCWSVVYSHVGQEVVRGQKAIIHLVRNLFIRTSPWITATSSIESRRGGGDRSHRHERISSWTSRHPKVSRQTTHSTTGLDTHAEQVGEKLI